MTRIIMSKKLKQETAWNMYFQGERLEVIEEFCERYELHNTLDTILDCIKSENPSSWTSGEGKPLFESEPDHAAQLNKAQWKAAIETHRRWME